MTNSISRTVVTARRTTQHTSLGEGARGPQVERLQRLLERAGFSPKGVDGAFGPNTKSAVVAFQRSAALPPTGVANEATWSALEHKVNVQDAKVRDARFVKATVGARSELLAVERQVDAFVADGTVTRSEKQQLAQSIAHAKSVASSLFAKESNGALAALEQVRLMNGRGELTTRAQEAAHVLTTARTTLVSQAHAAAARNVFQPGWARPMAGIATHDFSINGLKAHVVAIDLADPRVKLETNSESQRGKSVERFAMSAHAEVAINGDFFSWGSFKPSGLAVSDGQKWNGTSGGFEGFLAFNGSHADVMGPRSHNPEWSRNVVSSRPTVLMNGKLTLSDPNKNERSARTGVGLSKDGRVLYLLAVEGKSGVRGLTATELGKAMRSLGADDAMAMDSGGSAQLYVAGRGMVQRSTDPGGARAVANVLMVQSTK